MYITTIRSVIEYASPVLFCLDEGRFEKLERIQNEAMRIILNCPKNALIDAMTIEIGLPRIKSRVDIINISAAIRHMRNKGGHALVKDINDCINNTRTFWRQGKRGYIKSLVSKIQHYNLTDNCVNYEKPHSLPPWEETNVNLHIETLEKKKEMYDNNELKSLYEKRILLKTSDKSTLVFCDGSVMEDGRAGCGILVRKYIPETNRWLQEEHGYRLGNNISSTQAELHAVLFGLKQ